MLRGVAILLIVGMTIGTGITACPHPATACGMSMRTRHACCDHVALRLSQCCCADGQRNAQLVSTAGPLQSDHGARLLVAVLGWQPSAAQAVAATLQHRTRAGYGPAPPHTPLRNHTQLLI